MPVIRQEPQPTVRRADLVSELYQEWKGQTTGKQPLIYENEIARTGSLHVLVVWDKWAGVEDGERSAIIREAFGDQSPKRGLEITIALGLTMEEAIAMGYFPYKIEPAVTGKGEVSQEQIKEAMLAERAITTKNGLELRYRTLQEAFEAYQRLNEKHPGCWTVPEPTSSSDTGSP